MYLLRKYNITFHTNIREKKERISDVMAIYMVRPTEENFKIITNDLQNRIFDNFYINFVETCDEDKFHSFFSSLIKTDNYNRIYKIIMNPIGFFVEHSNVFSLDIKEPYCLLNSPNVGDSEIESYFDQVGNGIFNSLFTTRTIPIIKYRTGWSADHIVNKIQSNFDQSFNKFPELKEEFSRKNNTLLLILDRDTDLPIMLHHSASLGSMLNDIFGITRTKTDKTTNKFEIDPMTDFIWNDYLSTNFDDAKKKIIEEYKAINEQTGFLDQNKTDPQDIEKISERLTSTLEGLRDLTVKQTVLTNHANFQDKMYKEIDKRQLGQFYDIEESILNKRSVTSEYKKKFLDLLKLKSVKLENIQNSKNDLLRIALMYYLINSKMGQEEVQEIESALKNVDQKLSALDYLKRKKSFEDSMKKGNTDIGAESGFFQKSVSFFKNRIGSLMTNQQVSVVADLAASASSNKEIPNFVTYNLLKKRQDSKISCNFNQVIVFMVGGGCLSEFEYLDEIIKKENKNVISKVDFR